MAYILIGIAIILFVVGAWPIGLGIAVFGIYKTISKRNKEVQKLRQELEAQKAVAAAIEKSESKRES